jgi:hypothetical protein
MLEEGRATDEAGAETAVVNVNSRSGRAEGVLVSYRRTREARDLRIEERWPDGTSHAYSGAVVGADDIEVWPSSFTTG